MVLRERGHAPQRVRCKEIAVVGLRCFTLWQCMWGERGAFGGRHHKKPRGTQATPVPQPPPAHPTPSPIQCPLRHPFPPPHTSDHLRSSHPRPRIPLLDSEVHHTHTHAQARPSRAQPRSPPTPAPSPGSAPCSLAAPPPPPPNAGHPAAAQCARRPHHHPLPRRRPRDPSGLPPGSQLPPAPREGPCAAGRPIGGLRKGQSTRDRHLLWHDLPGVEVFRACAVVVGYGCPKSGPANGRCSCCRCLAGLMGHSVSQNCISYRRCCYMVTEQLQCTLCTGQRVGACRGSLLVGWLVVPTLGPSRPGTSCATVVRAVFASNSPCECNGG